MILLILAPILLLVLWLSWPWPAAALVNRSLPMSWGDERGTFTLTEVAGSPPAALPQAQARFTIPVKALRALVATLGGFSIPPGSLRGGLSAGGTWSWSELGPAPRPWQAEAVWSGERIRLLGRLPLADINRYIAYRLSLLPACPLTGATLTRCRITDGDLATPDSGRPRRLAIEAAGAVTWHYLTLVDQVAISRCTGWLHVHFDPVAEGLHPVAHLELADLDTPLLSLPLVGQLRRLLIPAIEQEVDRSLAQHLEGVVIPGWVPTDLAIDIASR